MTSIQYDPPPADWPMPETFSSRAEPDDRATVAFVNDTNRDMLCFWYDPDGRVHSYGSIKAKSYAAVQTFKGHVWSFHDVADGSFLWRTNIKTGETISIITPPVSKEIDNVEITSPFVTIPFHIQTLRSCYPIILRRCVASLTDLAMNAVLRRCNEVDDLPLPALFKAELRKSMVLLSYVREKTFPQPTGSTPRRVRSPSVESGSPPARRRRVEYPEDISY